MSIMFQIDIKPISDNGKSRIVSRNRIIDSSLKKSFKNEMNYALKPFDDILSQFKNKHNGQAISLIYYVYQPKNEYFTKKGKMSLTRGDNANYSKIMTDVLFNYMGINDAYLNPSPLVHVIPSDKWKVVIELSFSAHSSSVF